MRLLVVEDDAELGPRLADRLRVAGFAVDLARSAAEAEAWPELDRLDVILLDLGLPDGDGLNLLRGWRAARLATPILILTARSGWEEKVEGLNAGADDFVVKPVRFEELVARLHALMRRHGGERFPRLEADGIVLDPGQHSVAVDGQPLQLSKQEFRLLHLFLRRRGEVLSQARILEHLYDLDTLRDSNTIEVLVGRLRRRIGARRIVTVRGFGYRFGAGT